MPKSKSTIFPITAAFVEFVHDELVAKYWGLDQPVTCEEYRDSRLIDSAVNRPFQSYGGVEFYPGLFPKAAPLFHSLVCNHPFGNGNKRTAVISVDCFLTANGMWLAMTNDQMYKLANKTATHNERGMRPDDLLADIGAIFREFTVPIEELANEPEHRELYEYARANRTAIRNHPTNQLKIYQT